MFGKRKCSHCNKKIEKKFDFCPYCASPLRDPKDYGLLGLNDEMDEMNRMFRSSFGGSINQSLFEKMLGSAMKMLQEEVRNMDQQEKKIPKTRNINSNFQLFINGREVPLPGNLAGIKIEKMPKQGAFEMEDENGRTQKTNKIPKVSEEIFKKSAKLPRKEPKSKLTRLKDKLIYELEIPGLNSLDKVLINKLENSIEIKAFTESAVYVKTLPAKLPLIQYSLSNGKLLLEFKAG